jgi:nucleoside phosphorylase
MPAPADAAQETALDAIWGLLVDHDRWPTFRELDQCLYRTRDLDAAHLLPELPDGLLYGIGSGRVVSPAGTTTIGLTAAGAAATGRAERELDLFLTVVRHAVAVERDFVPPADQPDSQAELAAADVAELLKLTLPEDAALLRRLSAVLYTERWGWTSFGGAGTDGWEVRIGREVRRFRHVPDLATYWNLRPKHWEPATSPSATSATTLAFSETTADYGLAAGQERAATGAATGSARSYGDTMDRVDVLVVAALPEEFEAAKAAGLASDSMGSGVLEWVDRHVDGVPPFVWGEYHVGGKALFTVALARPTQMGGRTAGPFAATLAGRLSPVALAMCGVCAGNPEDTALGDVVVGDPVYEWDEGKHSSAGFQGDHRQIPMDGRWLRAAQDFDPASTSSYGQANEDEALLWFLEQLARGQQPRKHPALSRYFPSGTWQPRLALLEQRGLIVRDSAGVPALTSDGSDLVQRRLYDDVDGPQRLPFRVLAAPMASGSAVVADPEEWGRLKAMGVRKITAIEMEAATIATVAHDRGLPWLVVKGVMDHADTKKDDRYKTFAARASAEVMFGLLERLVPDMATATPRAVQPATTVTANVAAGHRGFEGTRTSAADLNEVDVVSLLDEFAAGDPVPDPAARTNGRLYLVAHPVGAAGDALAEVSSTSATAGLDAAIGRAVAARAGQSFSPDLGSGTWRRRSSGMVQENGVRENGTVREDSLLILKVQENGTVGVLCGRATAIARSQWQRVGSVDAPPGHRVIFPSLVLGLVHSTLMLAADLANRYAGYDGPWAIGLRLTGLKTAFAYEYVQSGNEDTVDPYDADSYQKTARASTAALLEKPEIVTEQLVGALLRGLSVEKRYLPYREAE